MTFILMRACKARFELQFVWMSALTIRATLKRRFRSRPAGSSISSWAGLADTVVHAECTMSALNAAFPFDVEACWSQESAVPTTLPCRPCRDLLFRGTFPPAADIGTKTLLSLKFE